MKSVLVVEDESLVRLVLVAELEERGYRVLEAGDAAEAMAMVRQGAPIDALVTDVRMPGDLDGLALARWLRDRDPGAKIIVMSGYMGAGETSDAAAPWDAFICKPFIGEQVARQLQYLLGG